MLNSALGCSSCSRGGYLPVGTPAVLGNYRSLAPNMSGVAALADGFGLGGGYWPGVQVQAFEPAFWTPQPVFSVIPYSPATIAAVSPVFVGNDAARATVLSEPISRVGGGGALLAETAAVGAVNEERRLLPATPTGRARVADASIRASMLPPPFPFRANECGCCSAAYSPLPPNGVQAWAELLAATNLPYDSIIGPACSSCPRRLF